MMEIMNSVRGGQRKRKRKRERERERERDRQTVVKADEV